MNDKRLQKEDENIEVFGIDDVNTEVKSSDRILHYEENPVEIIEDSESKKKIILIVLLVVALVLLVYCGYELKELLSKGELEVNNLEDMDDELDINSTYQVDITSEYYPLVVGKYKGIEVLQEEQNMDMDEAISAYISEELEKHRISVEIMDESNVGDILNIDYIVEVGGKIIEHLSYENFDLHLGSGVFIEGVEEELLGAKSGDERIINVDFPEDSSTEELAGKKVTIKVTVNTVKRERAIELSDENVVEYLSKTSKTVPAYMIEVQSILEGPEYTGYSTMIRTQVWNIFIGQFSLDFYVEEEMEFYIEKIRKSIVNQAKEQGQTLEEYLIDKMMTDTEFEKFLVNSAEQEILSAHAVAYVADIEGLHPSENEYESEMKKLLTKIGYSSIDDAIKAGYTLEEFQYKVLSEVVLDWLVNNAKILTK